MSGTALCLEETVPLSEEELRLLEQMERALVAEDPKFASTLRGTKMRQHARRQVIGGIFVFVLGVALLMSGAVLGQNTGIVLGVLGFVVMLTSAYFTLNAWRGQNRSNFTGGATATPSGSPHLRVVPGGKSRRNKTRSPKPQGTMMQRFEERWRRRREQNGGF
jgi:hypothetical protein